MSNTIHRVIRKFEEAVRAHEMKGASHPLDWPTIDKNYEQAKADVSRAIVATRRKAQREAWRLSGKAVPDGHDCFLIEYMLPENPYTYAFRIVSKSADVAASSLMKLYPLATIVRTNKVVQSQEPDHD